MTVQTTALALLLTLGLATPALAKQPPARPTVAAAHAHRAVPAGKRVAAIVRAKQAASRPAKQAVSRPAKVTASRPAKATSPRTIGAMARQVERDNKRLRGDAKALDVKIRQIKLRSQRMDETAAELRARMQALDAQIAAQKKRIAAAKAKGVLPKR